MESRLLASDLYKYLVGLAPALEAAGETDAAARVRHVSKFASGSTSEFYGEARLLLPRVLGDHGSKLADADRLRLREVIEGIEREFARIGGA